MAEVLDELSLEGVARYIQSEKCKNVFIMAGAGISTSAGIPDFRSPDTGGWFVLAFEAVLEKPFPHQTLGLYANLARLNLPYPEAVFDIRFFRRSPLPFYTLAHELAPGRFRPTLAHSFIRLLHEKKLLHTCFTQNIDTLERKAGLSSSKIVEAHGSFASQRCIDCKAPYDDDMMKLMIRKKEIPRCEGCSGLVKPDIVFFGEALPPLFQRSIGNLPSADLLLILGTSLTVHPFASLTELVPDSCPRVLINLEAVGDIGSRVDDVVVLGKCDEIVQKLSKLLGWEHELDALWDETKGSLDPEDSQEDAANPTTTAEEEVQKLADEVGKTLKLASEVEQVVGQISAKQADAAQSTSAEGVGGKTKGSTVGSSEAKEVKESNPQNEEGEEETRSETKL